MNREQKSAAIAEIAAQIKEAQAILAVDYRGISVPQAAELRASLRQADATFRVVKNSLTERAADESGAETLKPLLTGPTALAFVRGDVATAAKAIADYGRATQLLPFKGGLMDGATLDLEQVRSLSRLPSRDVLYGQLVGVVASPVTGLVRSLGALLGGLAVALGQVREQLAEREPSGAAAPAAVPEDSGGSDNTEAAAKSAGAAEAEPTTAGETAPPPAEDQAAAAEDSGPAAEEHGAAVEPAADETATAAAAEEEQAPVAETPVAQAVQAQTDADEGPTQQDDDEADASGEAPAAGAEEKPAKED